MTNEELVQQIQAGNTDLLPELWDGVRHFVWQQAYKATAAYYYRLNAPMPHKMDEPGCVFFDFYNSGYIAVEEASRKYKPDPGVLFISYLGWHIKNQFSQVRLSLSDGWSRSSRECIKRDIAAKKVKESVLYLDSLNRQVLNEDSDDAIEQIDQIEDPTDFVEDLTERMYLDSLHNDLEKLLNQLDPDKAQAIRLHFYKNMTYEQAGQIMGVTGDGARWRISTGMRELRRLNMREKRLEAYIDRNTDFYHHIGVTAFQNTGMSSVEWACLKRMELRRKGLYHDEI